MVRRWILVVAISSLSSRASTSPQSFLRTGGAWRTRRFPTSQPQPPLSSSFSVPPLTSRVAPPPPPPDPARPSLPPPPGKPPVVSRRLRRPPQPLPSLHVPSPRLQPPRPAKPTGSPPRAAIGPDPVRPGPLARLPAPSLDPLAAASSLRSGHEGPRRSRNTRPRHLAASSPASNQQPHRRRQEPRRRPPRPQVSPDPGSPGPDLPVPAGTALRRPVLACLLPAPSAPPLCLVPAQERGARRLARSCTRVRVGLKPAQPSSLQHAPARSTSSACPSLSTDLGHGP
ncbi:formin-like protein 14 [Triticum aestivum]|uniref:formin-like protein 14 n=1 Tax=Triticum aestivum TaxID=4565 RepID=UPI001D00501D|nr:formin-like protein 14 [Triticum aestivum]